MSRPIYMSPVLGPSPIPTPGPCPVSAFWGHGATVSLEDICRGVPEDSGADLSPPQSGRSLRSFDRVFLVMVLGFL